MTEAAKALTAEETIQQIHSHIAAYLDGGPDRKDEDIELARDAGLKVEAVSARWEDAHKTVRVSLPPLEVVVLPEGAIGEEAVKAIAVASWRRDRKPKPEGFFKNLEAQPSVEPPPTTPSSPLTPNPEPNEAPAIRNAIKIATEAAKAKQAEPAPSLLDRPLHHGIAPGLVGRIAEYVLNSASYPSQPFAVAVGLAVVGTLISRRIAGPSGPRGTGTHLYQVIIGPTGSGKEHVRTTGKLLMFAANAAGLTGPGRFKSGAGIIKHLQKKPVSLCFLDEFGAYLARLGDPRASPYEREETEILRELWGISWGRYDSPQGAHDDTEAIIAPALSLLGMSTPKELYRACRSSYVSNGFLNRFILAEVKAAPPYREVSDGALEISKELRESLTKLYNPFVQVDPTGKPSFKLDWGPGAKEVYDAFRQEIECETDERRKELSLRSPEKAVRVATDVAAGCFAKHVARDHMEWGVHYVRQSDETLLVGVNEYMEEEKLEFSELCREIIRRVRHAGGSMRKREIGRSFQNNLRYKKDLTSALDHLEETGQLIFAQDDTGGRPSPRYTFPEGE
jgi:hypothetical protein